MDLLKERILEEGEVLEGNILKVDNFLNHQVDPYLMKELGKDFYEYFKDENITKVLTLEVSGIAMALMTALEFDVPLVFAKKIESKTLTDDVYEAKVFSYTKGREYTIRVDKKFLSEDDNVLIIDDFLANGKAAKGLIELCNKANVNISGIGITIEKSFQKGGKDLRDMGYKVYSQARIKSLENNQILFMEEDSE